MRIFTKTTLNSILALSFVVGIAVFTASKAEAGPFWFDDFSDGKSVSGLDLGSSR